MSPAAHTADGTKAPAQGNVHDQSAMSTRRRLDEMEKKLDQVLAHVNHRQHQAPRHRARQQGLDVPTWGLAGLAGLAAAGLGWWIAGPCEDDEDRCKRDRVFTAGQFGVGALAAVLLWLEGGAERPKAQMLKEYAARGLF